MKTYKNIDDFILVKLEAELIKVKKEIEKQKKVTDFDYAKKLEELNSIRSLAREYIISHKEKKINSHKLLEELDKLKKKEERFNREIKKQSEIDLVSELDKLHELESYKTKISEWKNGI